MAFKSAAMARGLKQEIELTVPGVVIEESMDSAHFPIMKFVKGSETIFVKIETKESAGRVDGIGLPQRMYSPHEIVMLQDSDTVSDKNLRYHLMASVAKMGSKISVYEIATMPADFTLTGATLVSTIKSDSIFGSVNSQ